MVGLIIYPIQSTVIGWT